MLLGDGGDAMGNVKCVDDGFEEGDWQICVVGVVGAGCGVVG